MIPSTAAVSFLITLCLSLVISAVVRRSSLRFGLVDEPDKHRKLHSRTIPLGGGIAVFATTMISIAGLTAVDSSWRNLFVLHLKDLAGLFLASSVVVVVGIIDDYRGLRGRQKLAGQLLAALILISFGLSIHRIQIFGWEISLGLAAIPFTLFWLLGAMNSINLLDGIDGLATTIGIILCGTIALMAVVTDHPVTAMVAVIFTAGLLGFLKFNFPPAKMFLGDAGSMLIGLVVGALAIQGSLKGPGTVLLAAPLAVLVIPILDSGAAIIRRKLTGRSIYSTDRGHLHHRLLQLFGNHKTLGVVALCCLFMSTAALMSLYWRNDFIALLSGIALISIFVVTRMFGHSELHLLAIRLRGFSRSLITPPKQDTSESWEDSVQLQGNRQWCLLWETLTEWADKLCLQQIRLDVNAPMLHEGYHASWKRARKRESTRFWKLELPLLVSEQTVGHLKIVGERSSASATRDMEELLNLLHTFETHLSELSEPEPADTFTDESAPEETIPPVTERIPHDSNIIPL